MMEVISDSYWTRGSMRNRSIFWRVLYSQTTLAQFVKLDNSCLFHKNTSPVHQQPRYRSVITGSLKGGSPLFNHSQKWIYFPNAQNTSEIWDRVSSRVAAPPALVKSRSTLHLDGNAGERWLYRQRDIKGLGCGRGERQARREQPRVWGFFRMKCSSTQNTGPDCQFPVFPLSRNLTIWFMSPIQSFHFLISFKIRCPYKINRVIQFKSAAFNSTKLTTLLKQTRMWYVKPQSRINLR